MTFLVESETQRSLRNSFYLQNFHVLLANRGESGEGGIRTLRRLNTAYAISNLKRVHYQGRAWRLNLSHCVRLVRLLAAFGEVLSMCPVKCVKSPVQLRSSVLLSWRPVEAVRPSVPPFDPASPRTRR